jgi:hypothetical protein
VIFVSKCSSVITSQLYQLLAGGNEVDTNTTIAVSGTNNATSAIDEVLVDPTLAAPSNDFYLNYSVMTFMASLVLSRMGQLRKSHSLNVNYTLSA